MSYSTIKYKVSPAVHHSHTCTSVWNNLCDNQTISQLLYMCIMYMCIMYMCIV